MSTEAPAELMRYGTMLQWLMQNGLTECEVERMIAKGVIRARIIKPGGRPWYNATQIKRQLFDGWEEVSQDEAKRA